MAEQISRRSNPVTSAGFEQPFETQPVRFGSGTLNLKDSLDAMEGWTRLTNVWHENEGEATARPGQDSIASHAGSGPVSAVRKLRDPDSSTYTRFWGVGDTLQRGGEGATTVVASGLSGQPLALVPHRPTLSGEPWMFVGDKSKMLKVRADGLALPIGLPIPTAPPTLALAPEYRTAMAQFESADGSQASAWTGTAGTNRKGYASGIPITVDDTTGYQDGAGAVRFRTTDSPLMETGLTYDSWWGMARSLNLNTLTQVGGSATTPGSDDDHIHLWLLVSHPHTIEEVRLYFVVSDDFNPTVLPGTSYMDSVTGAANTNAYVKSFRKSDWTAYQQGRADQIEAAEADRVHRMRTVPGYRYAPDYQDLRDVAYSIWKSRLDAVDASRTASLELRGGAHQWQEFGSIGVPLRRGDFQRLGESLDRGWGTITGIIVYVRVTPTLADRVLEIGLDGLWLTGGSGPDSTEPGNQPYDYRVTNYDPRTGAESNGNKVPDPLVTIDSVRRGIVVDPPAYGDAAVRQRFYRRGGSVNEDWFFVGQNDSDGGAFTDSAEDVEAATAGVIPTDHYQPVPTLDPDTGEEILAQPLPALWGPLEGMLLGCGDPNRPGHLYYCLAGQPDHWSATGNVEVCAPSEELMNGGLIGHQGFVFSRARLYLTYPNLSGGQGVTATPSLCTRGLLGRWSFCCGPGGIVYFVAEDGVFATSGGPEEWLSEVINPLFYGTAVNGYQPIDKAETHLIRLTVWENDLFFLYPDTAGDMQVLVYSILQRHWRHYHFAKEPSVVQGEDEDILILGGRSTSTSYTHEGRSDDGEAIACVMRTGSVSGGRREEKLFGDVFLDADTDDIDLTLQIFLNEETHANVEELIAADLGRRRFLIHAFGTNPQKAHSIAFEMRWSSAERAPILYQAGIAVTLQPDLTNTRVTNWDDLGSPDEVWLTGVTLDCDTGGAAKTILIERDFDGSRSTVATFDVTASNRHKFKFSWPAVPANQVRIRPDPSDCAPWLLYRADWIYVQEPPRIAKWDIHFENRWDQYYTGLDLYCDTRGQEKRIEVWVDETRLTHPHTGEPFWRVTAAGRRTVHLTLPWGRGHVFRFLAIDEHPGLLYTHRWHLQEEPSEQSNWNQNFSIYNTHADKWLKAVIFECDTFDQPKAVQVEVDGQVVETLTVRANGRKVVQLALSQQALGRVWRLFPVDAAPGRLYSAEPVFDEEPFQLNRWETQETNHNLPGWFYPLYAHITLKSSATVTLTTIIQHNQVGGTTTHSYTIPSTSGQKQRRFLHGFRATKGVLIKYLLTSPEPFWLYREETSIAIQPWGAYEAILVRPFGNDDLDPSRTMTHAVLAAAATGGAVPTASPGEAP
jgi:hypothetical protein